MGFVVYALYAVVPALGADRGEIAFRHLAGGTFGYFLPGFVVGAVAGWVLGRVRP